MMIPKSEGKRFVIIVILSPYFVIPHLFGILLVRLGESSGDERKILDRPG